MILNETEGTRNMTFEIWNGKKRITVDDNLLDLYVKTYNNGHPIETRDIEIRLLASKELDEKTPMTPDTYMDNTALSIRFQLLMEHDIETFFYLQSEQATEDIKELMKTIFERRKNGGRMK